VGVYINTYINTLDQVDRSPIFWYVIILFLGIGLVVAGIFFLVIGIYSFKGNTAAYTLTKYSLIVFVGMVCLFSIRLVLNEFVARQRATPIAQQEEMENKRSNSVQKIKSLSIIDNDEDGFTLGIITTQGTEDTYRLIISIRDSEATFQEYVERFEADSGGQIFQKRVEFSELFQTCFDELEDSVVSVCTEGAGTSGSKFTVTAELESIDKSGGKDGDLEKTIDPGKSGVQTHFYVDTYTENGEVTVENFRLEL
jgi:hypothetical protein